MSNDANERNAGALRDIVWDQIDILRDPNKSRLYDMKKGDQILKAADTIINTWKVELAAKALVMKETPPPAAEPAKEIEHANGEKVAEGHDRAGEAGEAGRAQAADPSGGPEVETATP